MKCPTVKVYCDGVYMVINESDFDKDAHELFVEKDGPNEGTVEWIKGELASLEVEIPEGAKKAELQELLDASLAA